MSSSSTHKICLFVLFLSYATVALAHSQMRCAKYDITTGTCAAPIRNENVSFLEEAYIYVNGAAICQSPMTNPISDSYGDGPGCPSYAPCPDQMGTYYSGEQFTIMWFARNHAVDDQSPGQVELYLSPKEASNQGQDVSSAAMAENLFCQGPYKNCSGINQDTTPCTLECTMPTNTQSGIYTLWWKWDWQNGVMYSTCADIVVTGSASPPISVSITSGKVPSMTSGATPAVSNAAVTTKSATTAAVVNSPVTTRAVVTPPVTTGNPPAATTGATVSTPSTTGSAHVGGSLCILGYQQCTSVHTYQTCGWATATLSGWGTNLTCPTGLSCHAVQSNYIWCY